MVQYFASVNTNRIDKLALSISLLPEMVGDEMKALTSDLEQRVPDELGAIPNSPAKLPLEFATPKSRRYYFWAVRTGKIRTDGKRYIRSGKASMGWKVTLDNDGASYLIRISNDWQASIYVYGTLAATGFDTRVQGHKNTGWQAVKPKADILLKPLLQEFRMRILAKVKKF